MKCQPSLSRVLWVVLAAGCAHSEARSVPQLDCLAAVSGDSASERRLRAAQAEARTHDTEQAWLTAGHAWLQLARTHSRAESFGAIRACSERALARRSNSAGARRLQSLALLDAHRFSEARALAQELLARDASDALSWGTLSDAELELGRVSEAIAAAQEMVDRKPGLLSYGRAAHLRWLTGDRDGAKHLYRSAIDAGRAQADAEPRTWLTVQAAWVFWHEGDYAGARRGFELALSQLPDYAPALEGLGRTALAQRDHVTAIAALERAQQSHPLAETLWWLADAYAAHGEQARATERYRAFTELAARSDPRTLALFYATRTQDATQALRWAELAFRERQDCYARDALAFALYRSGQLPAAARLARENVTLGVPDARLIHRAGVILRAAGAADGGTLIERARSLNPRFDTHPNGAST